MSVILPSSVSYGESLPALPDNTQCINIAAAPTNGATFTAGQQIYLDLVNRGFLVPDSMYLSYSYSETSAAGTQPELIGCPAVTTFNRLDVQVGSMTIDTIQQYNIFYNFLTNVTYDVAQKYGNQASLGYLNSTAVPTLEQLDGRQLTATTETGSFAFPLVSILSNAEKLIPLFAMPQVRIVLTMESIANMFTSTATPTAWSISNIQLRYKVVDFGGAVEQIVLGSSDKLYIKSQSFALASQTVAAGTTGFIELVYNLRYASVKSLFAINGNRSTGASNGPFDSVDLTSSTGDYSFSVGGVLYPPAPISTRTSKAQAMLELRSAVGSIFDKNNNMSINAVEFNLSGTAAASTYQVMAKFYVGTSTERLNSNNLLTGISTNNSPISYRINSGQSIGANNSTVSLIVNYDALIEVDTLMRQVAVKA